MKKLFLAVVLASAALPFAATPADAQPRYPGYEQYDCQRPMRPGESRSHYRLFQRNCIRAYERGYGPRGYRPDWRRYRDYDHDRYEPGRSGYWADEYYRDGRYYRERRLTRRDRIYRGRDGRYYCRRDDGTTGLIVGGAIGAIVGSEIDRGHSSVLGALIGGAAGALIGREIDRGELRCR